MWVTVTTPAQEQIFKREEHGRQNLIALALSCAQRLKTKRRRRR